MPFDEDVVFDQSLDLISVKTRLIYAFKKHLTNMSNIELNLICSALDVLKEKYGNDTNSYNFIEVGVRANLQNHGTSVQLTLSNIGEYLLPFTNKQLLLDLLHSIGGI